MTNPTQLIEQLVAALETAKNWHQGDKWRNGNFQQQETWAAFHRELEAALTAARAHLEQPTEPAPSTAGEQEDKIVNLPIPASASDLKSDIAELIQSHKYKGLRSIEVLGVFQFLGAEIISGSSS